MLAKERLRRGDLAVKTCSNRPVSGPGRIKIAIIRTQPLLRALECALSLGGIAQSLINNLMRFINFINSLIRHRCTWKYPWRRSSSVASLNGVHFDCLQDPQLRSGITICIDEEYSLSFIQICRSSSVWRSQANRHFYRAIGRAHSQLAKAPVQSAKTKADNCWTKLI